MHKQIFALLFLACLPLGAAIGQLSDGTALMEILNKRLSAVEKGSFTIDAQFKFADGADTIAHRGICYFFREPNADSLAQFVVLTNDKPVLAFDGATFYQSIGADKMWVTSVASAGGVRRMLRGNVMKSNLVYEPPLRLGQPNFALSGFDSVEISTLRWGELPLLRLTVRDTAVEQALGDVENNKIISAQHWDIALPDFYLARRIGEVWLFDGWQYEQKMFSPVSPLPATAQFSDYFNPEKLAASYTFEQYDPNQPPRRDRELIAAGAQLPDFTLADLEGKPFAPGEQQAGLLLLDFWYKGCFPCQLAMPKLESLHQKYAARGLKVLGVNPFDANNAALKDWLRARKITYNTVFDPDKKLPEAVGIRGYPLLIIADAKTREVLLVHTGFSEDMEAELEAVILQHLH